MHTVVTHKRYQLCLLRHYKGYLENPLDPLNPLAPRPSTHDPRPSTKFKKNVCLYNFNFCIITAQHDKPMPI